MRAIAILALLCAVACGCGERGGEDAHPVDDDASTTFPRVDKSPVALSELARVARSCGLRGPLTPHQTQHELLHSVPVPAEQAVAVWKQLRVKSDETGFYPLIIHG